MTLETQPLHVWLADAQITRDFFIMLAHLRLIEVRLRDLERVVQKQRRIKPQRRHLTVAGEERIAPAQRYRVFQIEILHPAQQAEEGCTDHQCRTPDRGPAFDRSGLTVQGDTLKPDQYPAEHCDREQPTDSDPHHWIGLPEHVPGNLRILQIAQHTGVEPDAEIGVMTEIDDVDHRQNRQRHDQITSRQPAQGTHADQVPARQPEQHRDWQQYQQRQAQVETQTDAQRLGDLAMREQRARFDAGKPVEEHAPQQRRQQEHHHDRAQPIMQASRLQPTHRHSSRHCRQTERPDGASALPGDKQNG